MPGGDAQNPKSLIRFGDFQLDPVRGTLSRGNIRLKLQPQPFLVLKRLLEKAPLIVSREELHREVWGTDVNVDVEHSLNYCIRQIRLALRDEASKPLYVETLPKEGYRFIAPVIREKAELPQQGPPVLSGASPARGKRFPWQIAAGVFTALAVAGALFYSSVRGRSSVRAPRGGIAFTQLTDFTDSAVAPALSPDGQMLAFIRGSKSFLGPDQIWVKILPGGEARQVTEDPRLKYNIAFSPDGSQLAYTVMYRKYWDTQVVSVLGGDSHLFLKNASGLSWLDPKHLLFSQIREGQHMGIVTGTAAGEDGREIYFPAHERAMAIYSYASPDHKSALVVEMNGKGDWTQCRLLSLGGGAQPVPLGPPGACESAGWSPDGSWMFFTAHVEGQSHLWRQRFPDGPPEQLTFGPTDEEGVAVEKDGRSIITSMGEHESAIWIHDAGGERSLSSEGEVDSNYSPPTFSPDGKILYYLLRHRAVTPRKELWRTMVESGKSEAIFPGIDISSYDVSRDGRQVVYCTGAAGATSHLWLAATDRSSSPKRIGTSGETSPHFGPRGQILFLLTEGNFNYVERMNLDGTGRSKVAQYPISAIRSVSPSGRWVMAAVPLADRSVAAMAIPTDGGPRKRVCEGYCTRTWSPDGKFLFVSVEEESRTSPGRSLAIPLGPGETLPDFPPDGIASNAEPGVVPGSRSVARADLVPGRDPSHFAYVKTTVHRNLYRVSLP